MLKISKFWAMKNSHSYKFQLSPSSDCYKLVTKSEKRYSRVKEVKVDFIKFLHKIPIE